MSTQEASATVQVREYLQQLMAERAIPGLQVAVVQDRQIALHDTLGLANVEHRVPVTDQSIFSINSMAKAFTGVALMQLVEADQLELSAPISTYLDGLPEHWQPITVRQLATLTSGAPEIMVYTAEINVALIGGGGEEEAWDAAYAAAMEYPTGQGYRYTQTNYALLGKIISRLSGKPFAAFIAERQFAVAGMPNTGYFTDQDIVPNRANTYMSISTEGEPAGKIFNSHLNWPPILRTAAGLQSTAGDLANWIIALQSGELLEQASSIETMLTPVSLHDGQPGVWGIGWIIGSSASGHFPAPGGGAKAQIVLYPGGTAIVLLTNLIGAFPEHLAVPAASRPDLAFIDPIAELYCSR